MTRREEIRARPPLKCQAYAGGCARGQPTDPCEACVANYERAYLLAELDRVEAEAGLMRERLAAAEQEVERLKKGRILSEVAEDAIEVTIDRLEAAERERDEARATLAIAREALANLRRMLPRPEVSDLAREVAYALRRMGNT